MTENKDEEFVVPVARIRQRYRVSSWISVETRCRILTKELLQKAKARNHEIEVKELK